MSIRLPEPMPNNYYCSITSVSPAIGNTMLDDVCYIAQPRCQIGQGYIILFAFLSNRKVFLIDKIS